jgi:hypothetical protein
MPSRIQSSAEVAYQTFIKQNERTLQEMQDELKIDKNDLDSELVNQPNLYFKVGKFYAEAMSVRDAAKLNRDKEQAELDRLVRQEAYDANEKITETQVLNRIKENPSYDVVQDRYAQLSKIAEVWLAMKESFQQRSYAIKDLCALWIANYYTDSVGNAERNQSRDRTATSNRERMAEARRNQ